MKKFNLLRCVVCLLLISCVLLNISPIKVHATGIGGAGALAGATAVSVPAAPVIIACLAAIGIIIVSTEFRYEIVDFFVSLGEDFGVISNGEMTVYEIDDMTYLPVDMINFFRETVSAYDLAHYIPDLSFSSSWTCSTKGSLYTRNWTVYADSPFTMFRMAYWDLEMNCYNLIVFVASPVSQMIRYNVTSPTSSNSFMMSEVYGGYYLYPFGVATHAEYQSQFYPELPTVYGGDFSSSDELYDSYAESGFTVGGAVSRWPVDSTGYKNPDDDIVVAYPNWTGSVTDTAGNKYYPVTVPPTVEEASKLTQDEAQVGVVIVVPGTGSDSDPDPTEPVVVPPDSPDIDDPDNPDNPDVPSDGDSELNTGFFQGLWNQLSTLFTTYIVNPIKEFWSNTVASLDLPTFWNNLTTAFKTHIADPITRIWDNTVASIQAGTFWQTLGETILSPVKWLGDHLLSGISSLFFPSSDYLTSKVEALLDRFSFLRSIVDTGKAIGESLSGIDTEPPIIYAELDDSTGKYDYGERAVVLDMRWYADYKPTVDAILSAVFWALFCWRMFIHAPNIISGVASNVGHVVTSYQRDSNRRQK